MKRPFQRNQEACHLTRRASLFLVCESTNFCRPLPHSLFVSCFGCCFFVLFLRSFSLGYQLCVATRKERGKQQATKLQEKDKNLVVFRTSMTMNTHNAMMIFFLWICFSWTTSSSAVSSSSSLKQLPEYGVDISFPIHKNSVSQNYASLPHNQLPSLYPTPSNLQHEPIQPLGGRQKIYDDFYNGCIQEYDIKTGYDNCRAYEEDRIEQNLRQPKSMVNYTETGFTIVKAPSEVQVMLQEFWNQNAENWELERWPHGSTFVNHWSSPTYLVNVHKANTGGGRRLRGGSGGDDQKSQPLLDQQLIWDTTKSAIENWTGQENLGQHKMYGIRVYTEGAMLNSHVDHIPHVFSAIINVAQDVDEPWPLEVIGHDGFAHNITMDIGDMILYESCSIVHGRPFALKGRYMANMFLHFEPIDNYDATSSVPSMDEKGTLNTNDSSNDAMMHRRDGYAATYEHVPDYILPNSQSAGDYLTEHYHKEMKEGLFYDFSSSSLVAHALAARGRTDELIELIEDSNEHLVKSHDPNGWTPFHESCRSGSLDIVQYLLDHGADINERTHWGTGGTPLYFAIAIHGEYSSVAQFLKSVGAVSIVPDPDP